MLKSVRLRKQRQARARSKVVKDAKILHAVKVELYNRLEELETVDVIALEIAPSRVSYLLELIDDDFKMMYTVKQITQTLYEFKLKEIG